MSNRDGKHCKVKLRSGKKCPRCDSKLERVYGKKHPKKHWRNYVFCCKCKFTNY